MLMYKVLQSQGGEFAPANHHGVLSGSDKIKHSPSISYILVDGTQETKGERKMQCAERDAKEKEKSDRLLALAKGNNLLSSVVEIRSTDELVMELTVPQNFSTFLVVCACQSDDDLNKMNKKENCGAPPLCGCGRMQTQHTGRVMPVSFAALMTPWAMISQRIIPPKMLMRIPVNEDEDA